MATAYCQNDFYPRPPRGGRRQQPYKISCPQGISIHALREEGDQAAAPEAIQPKEFLSTPSARRATGKQDLLKYSYGISIHALREEGDCAT